MGADSSKPEQDRKVRVSGRSQEEQHHQIRDLLEDIRKRSAKVSTYCKNESLRIALCGSVRAGKSSLVNNILSAVKGVLVHTANVGNVHGHVTGKYTEYRIDIQDEGTNGRKTYFVVCDTMGFDINKPEDHVDSVRAVLEGYCTPNQSMANIQTDDGKKSKSSKKRQAACIIFVADATQLENKKDYRSLMIESIQMFALNEQIPVCVFLTFCDKLDGDVDIDMENIYKSAKVNRAINLAHAQFNGVPKGRIYPIVNYTDQRNVEPQMRLLTLRALCDIVRDVESHVSDVVRDAYESHF